SSFGDFTSVRVAGAGQPAPDIHMQTTGGKLVGREMQVVGPKVTTTSSATPQIASADLENALAKAIKDKAINYMRDRTPNYDSQEIVIQIKPSQGGYNYDHLLEDPALFARVIPRAFASTDYIDAAANAKARTATNPTTQPAVKPPDRIAIYNSKG